MNCEIEEKNIVDFKTTNILPQSTSTQQLHGNGGNTYGDWVTGTPYQIFDPSSNNDFTNPYSIDAFPTIFLVCQNKRIYRMPWDGDGNFSSGTLSEQTLTSEMQSKCSQSSEGAIAHAVNVEELPTTNDYPETSVIEPSIVLQNVGAESITTMTIEYSIAGVTQNYNWSGSIASAQQETITLPEISYTPSASNNLSITVTSVNGGEGSISNATLQRQIGGAARIQNENIHVVVNTGWFSNENSWKIFDEEGNIVASKNFSTSNDLSVNTEHVTLLASGCYQFEFYDTGGDCIQGGGSFQVQVDGMQVLYVYGESFSDKYSVGLYLDTEIGVEESIYSIQDLSVYPNPSAGQLKVAYNALENENVFIEIVDVTGRVVFMTTHKAEIGKNSFQIDKGNLTSGVYTLLLKSGTSLHSMPVIFTR